MDKLDLIIGHDPYHFEATHVKGKSLWNVNPEDAIKALELVLDLDQKGRENDQMPDPHDSTEEEQIRQMEAYNPLTQSKDFYVNTVGTGRNQLFLIVIWMAEAHEVAGNLTMPFQSMERYSVKHLHCIPA
jgi:hypothetical protein